MNIVVSEFGEAMLSLKLSQLRTSLHLVLKNPVAVIDLPLRDVAIERLSKLEIVQLLLQQGWSYGERPLPVVCGGERTFSMPGILRSKSYLVCLAMSDAIFEKPGALPQIPHNSTQYFYRCLISLGDLSTVVAADMAAMRDGDWKRLLNAGGSVDRMCIEDDVLAVDGDAEPLQEAAVRAPAGMLPWSAKIIKVKPQVVSKAVVVPGFDLVTVCFDNFSHSSGELRAFVQCGSAESPHGRRCRCYRQINKFPSIRHCTAHLVAWCLSGKDSVAVDGKSAQECSVWYLALHVDCGHC